MSVEALRGLGSVDPRQAYRAVTEAANERSFADSLRKAVDDVNAMQTHRDEMIDGMVAGNVTEVHDVMVAAEEAQMAFELLLEVRNKLLDAYREIMKMQV